MTFSMTDSREYQIGVRRRKRDPFDGSYPLYLVASDNPSATQALFAATAFRSGILGVVRGRSDVRLSVFSLDPTATRLTAVLLSSRLTLATFPEDLDVFLDVRVLLRVPGPISARIRRLHLGRRDREPCSEDGETRTLVASASETETEEGDH